MTTKDITMTSLSFAQTASLPASKQITHNIPTGSWTLYFHEPEDKTWTPDSYKRIQSVSSWEDLGAVLHEMGPSRILNGMIFCMRGDISPLWENKSNIRGGSYCLKVNRRIAYEIYQLYLAAAACNVATTDASNAIVGVTMSPKKGFCIIKLWNANAKAFNRPTDIAILHNDIKAEEVLYRPHTEQKM